MVFSRDFMMRQIQQLVQVLLQVMLKKQQDRPEEARSILNEGLKATFDQDLDSLLAMDQGEFMALCSPRNAFHAELAVALADLLREDASAEAHDRAEWLYKETIQHGAALSLEAIAWLNGRDARRRASE